MLGTAITVLTGSEPGVVLGAFLVTGTAAACLAVRPGAVYRIIPAPALAYLAAAAAAGLIHDRAADTSRTALAISAAQWIAGGFPAMSAATTVAVAVAAVRWQRSRRRPRYRSPATQAASSRDPAAGRSPSARRSL